MACEEGVYLEEGVAYMSVSLSEELWPMQFVVGGKGSGLCACQSQRRGRGLYAY